MGDEVSKIGDSWLTFPDKPINPLGGALDYKKWTSEILGTSMSSYDYDTILSKKDVRVGEFRLHSEVMVEILRYEYAEVDTESSKSERVRWRVRSVLTGLTFSAEETDLSDETFNEMEVVAWVANQ